MLYTSHDDNGDPVHGGGLGRGQLDGKDLRRLGVRHSPYSDVEASVAAVCADAEVEAARAFAIASARTMPAIVVEAIHNLEVGGPVVNGSSNFRLDHLPFGGIKDSGIGRESPRWMIKDFTYLKTVHFRGLSLRG